MMTPYNYRPLSADEILRLEQNRCTADDWSRVLVARDFSTDTVVDAHFHGDIRLGLFRAPHAGPCGMQRPSGVYRATLCNVAVGDDCRIADIADFIGNYDIGRGSRVEHVEQLYTEGPTAFGRTAGAKWSCTTSSRPRPPISSAATATTRKCRRPWSGWPRKLSAAAPPGAGPSA